MPALRSPLIHPFSNFDVPHLLRVHVEARPDHPFLIWEPFEGEARVWSYARFEHEVRQVAAGLKKRGVKQGERVLIHLDNCPESLIAWYACAHLGAVAVTTNARSVADDLIYFSGHAEVVGAITQPAFASLVASLMVFTSFFHGSIFVAGDFSPNFLRTMSPSFCSSKIRGIS